MGYRYRIGDAGRGRVFMFFGSFFLNMWNAVSVDSYV